MGVLPSSWCAGMEEDGESSCEERRVGFARSRGSLLLKMAPGTQPVYLDLRV